MDIIRNCSLSVDLVPTLNQISNGLIGSSDDGDVCMLIVYRALYRVLYTQQMGQLAT